VEREWGQPDAESLVEQSPAAPSVEAQQPFLIAAHLLAPLTAGRRSAGHFNGKIEAPRLLATAVAPDSQSSATLSRLWGSSISALADLDLIAAWDFARDIPTTIARDIGPNRLDGRCINLPTRGVTGHNWSAQSSSWRERPAEYAALHFHSDDLYD